jgi:hypothetical protein
VVRAWLALPCCKEVLQAWPEEPWSGPLQKKERGTDCIYASRVWPQSVGETSPWPGWCSPSPTRQHWMLCGVVETSGVTIERDSTTVEYLGAFALL